MTSFQEEVFLAVASVPLGRVASYGKIAELAGRPRAYRAVGNILHKNPCPVDIPCHRVVHADGALADAFAFGGVGVQRTLLIDEGVGVRNNKVDMEKYGI
jgi:O-6-methylguanine DNA methyltransferase